jgi:hypothetical protein
LHNAIFHQPHAPGTQARAKGAAPDQAYEDAGFVPGNCHASRLMMRPEIAARIAELRETQYNLDDARAHGVIAAMLRAVKASDGPLSPAAMKEIRLTLLEVRRLYSDLETDRKYERKAALAEK